MDPGSRPPEWIPLHQALGLNDGGVVTLVGAGGKTTLMFALARQLASPDSPVLTTTTTKIQLPTPAQSPHLVEVSHANDFLHVLDRLDPLPAHLTALTPVDDHPEKRTGLSPPDIDTLAATGRFRWIIVEGDGAARKPLKAPAVHEPVIPDCSTHVIVVAGIDGLGNPLDEAHVHRADLFSKLSGLPLGETVTPEALTRIMVHPKGGLKDVPGGARVTIFVNKADSPRRRTVAETVARRLVEGSGGRLTVLMGAALTGRAIRVF
jgi:probable selenium-dependent hydroxylase accessory protein YqeC